MSQPGERPAWAQNRRVTDELEHTLSVRPTPPPELVEPPAPERRARASSQQDAAPEPAPPTEARQHPEPVREATDPISISGPREPRRPYRLKMADGVVVALDLTVYLGRKPSVPRIASDRRVRLVAVPSAGKQVSATHLELRQNGDAVVATDMRSTNGSTVIVPGSTPRTLLRGESAVVTPGTLIDLGDGNVLELLSPERLIAEQSVDEPELGEATA
jgi:hypothetical protein